MKLDGRRESTNVDDRRGGSTIATAGGIGLGGIIIIGLITLLMGGDPTQVLEQMGTGTGMTQVDPNWQPSAEEEELATFAKQILAGTEDVWTRIFQQNGRTYEPPKLVLFSNAVQSGCGGATSSSGPFYC
ncbi:MAG: neutral zinc metallopeptidase, partial [Bacteroidales bacterium]|nr:neutral zinc metallopeptidase [Bacteroidales bacterium]